VLTILLGIFFWRSYSSLSAVQPSDSGKTDWSTIENGHDKSAWVSFFRKTSKSGVSSVAKSYRLAGTFFEFGASQDTRKAILDEIGTGRQHIVAQGQSLSDLLVLQIEADHVLVRAPSGAEEELWLSFRAGGQPGTGGISTSESTESDATSTPDGFGGRQVGENRWVFEREKLMAYYADLMSEPERLVKVFDSFKPMYTTDGKIDGYEIEVFGEQPFFSSTGLEPGDKIRAVNSIQMTNRRRAEYLIAEFVKERVNVVVMDIERNGKSQKFIYQIR
jgi:type II secretory pathway component PulC